MEDGRIADNQITASSEWRSNHGAEYARLNRPAQSGTSGAWSARYNDANQWIQADIGDVKSVTGVMIQGRSNSDQWVTTFYVQNSLDGDTWNHVQEGYQVKVSLKFIFFSKASIGITRRLETLQVHCLK